MAAPNSSSRESSVDEFLHKLLNKKQSYSSIFTSPPESGIPTWAARCPNLLYTPKSIPKMFPEPNKLYISYERTMPSSVGLIGETENKKRINRTLNVETRGSSVIVRSKHKNIVTNDIITFEGTGTDFETAISDYFKKSDLKNTEYRFSIQNIQKEGDAFLLQQTIGQKGYTYVVGQIIEATKKLFDLVEKDKHDAMMAAIHSNVKNIAPEIQKISHAYDARLWSIVETICKFFDASQKVDEHTSRKSHRDHLIAECCSNLMKGQDVAPGLKDYLESLETHNKILKEYERGDLHDTLKDILHKYNQEDYLPEVSAHREKIKNCYDEYMQACEVNISPKL